MCGNGECAAEPTGVTERAGAAEPGAAEPGAAELELRVPPGGMKSSWGDTVGAGSGGSAWPSSALRKVAFQIESARSMRIRNTFGPPGRPTLVTRVVAPIMFASRTTAEV